VVKSLLQTLAQKAGGQASAGQKRFVLLGLPRSGTTYLMSLLNAHPDVYCSGEQYNPYAVVGDKRDDRHETVLNRDKDPVGFLQAFFETPKARRAKAAGFKFMIGHNIEVLKHLEADPDTAIVHIWRENRLAQVSSLIKAAASQKWAQSNADEHIEKKINATPRQISHRWHEYATFDHLIGIWLAARPNPKITLEYRELFAPGFEERICGFLGLEPSPKMKSALVKQGANTILDRFTQPKPIRYYFTQIGKAHWLDEEL